MLVWLRHFGCMFCKEQASDVRRIKGDIQETGARLAFVGHGGVEFARAFHDAYAPNCAVYTDPSAYTYRTLGASESMLGTVAGFGIFGLRAIARGHVQTRILGRAFQNGGVLIAMPDGTPAYTYISRIAGDHPKNPVVLDALRAAVAHAAVTEPVYEELPPELMAVSAAVVTVEAGGAPRVASPDPGIAPVPPARWHPPIAPLPGDAAAAQAAPDQAGAPPSVPGPIFHWTPPPGALRPEESAWPRRPSDAGAA